jgi:anthraniloyl-CoA monooxygenase
MDKVRDEFRRSAQMARRAGFDWLELHYAHGYLMSASLRRSPNRRATSMAAVLRTACGFRSRCFCAVRAVWPDDKPISVRISANDWVPDGISPPDAVEVARMLTDAGVDMIDVSDGQTTKQAKPVYGRMFQTPFSDRIRKRGRYRDARGRQHLRCRPRQFDS